MVTFFSNVLIDEDMIHCNFDNCISSEMICVILKTVITQCNIVNNKPGLYSQVLIFNGGYTNLVNCVLLLNTHLSFFYYSNYNITSCFLCNNGFSYKGQESCVPTIHLVLRDAESCHRNSIGFTDQKLLASNLFIFHSMITQI